MTVQLQRGSDEAMGQFVEQRWGALLEEIGAGAAARYAAGETFPRRFLTQAADLDLQRQSLPQEIGGGGMGLDQWGRVLEEITYRCDEAAFSLVVSMTT